jgi:4'-phosphopantetheinyl transferase
VTVAAPEGAARAAPLLAELERSRGVHLFVVRLPLSPEAELRARSRLAPGELERAAGVLHPGARDRYVAGRAALRTIAAECGCGAPGEVEIEHGPAGKPQLAAAPRLGVNVSHTGDVAVVAAVADAPVGVDVEASSREVRAHAIASRFFHPSEAEHLASLGGREATDWFVACWTAKEAVGKALGRDIGAILRSVVVEARPGAPIALRRAPGGPPPGDWSLYQLALTGGRETVAVAVPAPGVPLASVRPLHL